MLGGFNAIRKIKERNELSRIGLGRKEIEDFNVFIENKEMLDILMIGRKFNCIRLMGQRKVDLTES